jgi:cell division septum initiation protein DivIVA
MDAEMLDAIAEELGEVESLPELAAIRMFGTMENNEYAAPEVAPLLQMAEDRLVKFAESPEGKIKELERQIAELQEQAAAKVPPEPTKRALATSNKRYRLLSKDVSWTSTPQIHALMSVIGAHMEVGDVLEEAKIVEACEANAVAILRTTQGGERIWKYYHGNHNRGLEAHGNIEEVK